MKTNTTYQENYQTLPISTKLARWPFILLPVLLIAIIAYFFIGTFLKTVLIASSFILLFFKEAYGRLRLKEIKKQRYTTQKPYAWHINDPKETEHPDFKKVKQQFVQLQESTSKSILFIIERVSPEDHQAQLYESIAQDLRKDSRSVERFFHRGDYELFWTEGYPEEISAEELTSKYANWLPIFCSDGHRLIDFEIESLSDTVFPFYAWKQRMLMTNRPALSWGYEEELLSVVFTIFSFNLSGVNAISALTDQRSGLHHLHQPDEKPELFLKDDEKQVPNKLEAHFGKGLTRWIAATALCSKLDWDLTLKIGEYLSNHYKTLNNHTQLRQLSRLGWFRVGEMPEQVRKQLIQYLPTPLQNEIRKLIVDAMEKSPPPHPSHAHNSYRMELVSHKLLIPGFPQKDLKEEFLELKSIGHIQEVDTLGILNHLEGTLNEMIPESLKKQLYNKGGALFGWNLKILIPFLFILSGAFAMTVDHVIPKQVSVQLSTTVKDIMGNKIEQPSFSSEFGSNISDQDGHFNFKIPNEHIGQLYEVTAKKAGYFPKTFSVEQGQEIVAIELLPKTVVIKIVADANRNQKIEGAKVTLLTNALTDKTISTDENGLVSLSLKNKYKPADTFDFMIEKPGFIRQTYSFRYNNPNKIVYLEEKQTDDNYLIGRIKNQCENPIDGVRVKIPGHPSVRTDKKGNFKIKLLPNNLEETIKMDFSKDKYHSKNKIITNDNKSNVHTILLAPKKVEIKVLDLKTNKRLKGVKVRINDSETKTTNEWGKCTTSLTENSKCEIEIIIDDERYSYLKETYKVSDKDIVISLKKKVRSSSKFMGFIKDKCGQPLDKVNITINGQTRSNISTSNGNVDFQSKENEKKIDVTISKNGFHDEKRTLGVNDLNRRKTFELSKNNIKFKIVNSEKKQDGIRDVIVRFADGKTGKTNKQGQFIISVDKGFDCSQKINIEHKGYKIYSKSLNMQPGTVVIELTPTAIEKPNQDFILEARVQAYNDLLSEVKVVAHDNRSSLEFKEIETGIFQYIVKEKEQPDLYKYLTSGNNLSITCSKAGYCEYTIRKALSKSKRSTNIPMSHYFKNFKMEVTKDGVHQGEAIFRYNDMVLKTNQTKLGFYELVKGDPKNDAIIKAIDKGKNCVIQVTTERSFKGKTVSIKDFCTKETVQFIF